MGVTYDVIETIYSKDIALAKRIARKKDDSSIARGHKSYVPNNSGHFHALGIEGELAFQNAFGIMRNHEEFKPDFLGFIEIRTCSKSFHGLPFRPSKDNENSAYVFVLADERPKYKIKGWEWGYNIKKHGTYKAEGHTVNNKIGAYYLYPRKYPLLDMSELMKIVDEKFNLKKLWGEYESVAV